MDVRRADLHTHTTCSDGLLSPTDLVRKARRHGVHALAVTDHDCVTGYDEAVAAGARYGVEVIPGVELSVTVGGEEVHLLGYLFDPRHPGLRAHFERYEKVRHERARQIVARLHGAGVPLPFARVLEAAGGGVLGRPHIAAALVEAGYAASAADAFTDYLRDGAVAHVEKPQFPAEEALALLHEAGGIGVLAHPGHWTRIEAFEALVPAGLDGIETIHPSHNTALTQYYREVAQAHGLVETGGSDYHGFRPTDEQNLGRCSIPYPQLERIRKRVQSA